MQRLGLDRFSGLYLLAAFIITFSFMAPSSFPTITTVHVIASSQAVLGLLALALLIPMVSHNFDLSVGAVANLAGVSAVLLQTSGLLGAIPATIVAVIIGLGVGVLNGFIVVKMRVESLIATIGTTSIVGAALLFITGSNEVRPLSPGPFSNLTQTPIFGFQSVVLYLIVIAIILWWVLERTPIGRYMHAVGSNPEAARLTGIKVGNWAWGGFIASGGLAAFAGVLFVSLTGPSIDFGAGLLLPAFAAVFLGATQIRPGRMNVWGTLVAIFVLAVGVQGLQLVTGILWVAPLFNGLALIVAVGLAAQRVRRVAKGRPPTSAESDGQGPDPTLLKSDAVAEDQQFATPSAFGNSEE